jgi:hypothetical protein
MANDNGAKKRHKFMTFSGSITIKTSLLEGFLVVGLMFALSYICRFGP